MSTSNRISEVIPADVIIDVTKKLDDCRVALAPYLLGLSEKERQDLFKMGDKTVATVQKVQSYVQTNPEFIPNYMQTTEFDKDVTVASVLSPIFNMASQLASDMSDTRMLAGSEALAEALIYYVSVREASKRGIPQAKPIYEDLKQRFTQRNRPKPE